MNVARHTKENPMTIEETAANIAKLADEMEQQTAELIRLIAEYVGEEVAE